MTFVIYDVNVVDLLDTMTMSVTGNHTTVRTDEEAQAFCQARWPGCEFAFTYLRDICEDAVIPLLPQPELIVIAVLEQFDDDGVLADEDVVVVEGPVPTYAVILASGPWNPAAWPEAYHIGDFADDVEELQGTFDEGFQEYVQEDAFRWN